MPILPIMHLDGLGGLADDVQEFFDGYSRSLIPHVATLVGETPATVRREISRVAVLPTTQMQGECVFVDGRVEQCEVRLHEGFFLFARCFAELLAVMFPVEKVPPFRLLDTAPLADEIFDRFFSKPDDLVGKTDLREAMFMGRRPLLEVLGDLHQMFDDLHSDNRLFRKQILFAVSTFALSHELGHYCSRKMNAELDASELDSVLHISKSNVLLFSPASANWMASWNDELLADRIALSILASANEELTTLGRELEGDGYSRLALSFDGPGCRWLGGLFTLMCLHAFDTYAWLRHNRPCLQSSHPPAELRHFAVLNLLMAGPDGERYQPLAEWLWHYTKAILDVEYHILRDTGRLSLNEDDTGRADSYFNAPADNTKGAQR